MFARLATAPSMRDPRFWAARRLAPALWGLFPIAPLAAQGDWAAAQRWVVRQVTPNRVVPFPEATRRGLVLSYDLSPGKSPHGFHRSATYDDALAALVFLVMRDPDRAAFTLHALARLVRPDGSLWFTYNTANEWPSEGDHESALVRAGTVSWVGYAFAFYLAHVPPRSGAADARERALFLETTRRLGGYVVSLQVRDSTGPRDGLVRLGYGTINLRYDTRTKTVVEQYVDEPAPGISTENNIAAWFFLRLLATVSGDTRWSDAADRIGHGLMASWSDSLGQFTEGFASDGARDPARALDCASLGVLFLLSRGETAQANHTLAAIERSYRSRGGGANGYRPYADRPIYEDSTVGRFYFPRDPTKQWRELPLVWAEGSLQVALAALRAGRAARARQVVRGVRPLQDRSGGVRYATVDLPFLMTDAPSVAGTAWLVLVSRALAGDSLAQAIWR